MEAECSVATRAQSCHGMGGTLWLCSKPGGACHGFTGRAGPFPVLRGRGDWGGGGAPHPGTPQGRQPGVHPTTPPMPPPAVEGERGGGKEGGQHGLGPHAKHWGRALYSDPKPDPRNQRTLKIRVWHGGKTSHHSAQAFLSISRPRLPNVMQQGQG